jgi:hypothetical protein
MAARHDTVLSNAFLQVANLQIAPTQLLRPSVVIRVLWGNFFASPRDHGRPAPAGAQA